MPGTSLKPRVTFASVARSCGHNHDALAGGGGSVDSASYVRVLAGNAHQAGEAFSATSLNADVGPWESSSSQSSDSRNRRDSLGVPD